MIAPFFSIVTQLTLTLQDNFAGRREASLLACCAALTVLSTAKASARSSSQDSSYSLIQVVSVKYFRCTGLPISINVTHDFFISAPTEATPFV